MADNILGLGTLLGGGNPHQTGTEALLRLQERQHQMDAMRYQMMAQAGMNSLVWGEPEKETFTISGGEGNAFVARFECPVTKEVFLLRSLERPAVERGMRHYTQKWRSAIRDLKSAGLKDEELHVALALIGPRLAKEAEHERSQEEGLRQAENKARSLLVMCLTPEQLAEFNEKSSFTINVEHRVSGFPTGAFRIRKGSSFNVAHVESGETFCVVSREKVPVYDQMLTQKLLLEQEPERFFKTANRSRGGGGGIFGGVRDDMIRYLEQIYREEQQQRLRDEARRVMGPPAVAPPPERDRDNPLRQAVRDFTNRYGL